MRTLLLWMKGPTESLTFVIDVVCSNINCIFFRSKYFIVLIKTAISVPSWFSCPSENIGCAVYGHPRVSRQQGLRPELAQQHSSSNWERYVHTQICGRCGDGSRMSMSTNRHSHPSADLASMT